MKYFDKKELEDYTLCAQKRKIEFDYTPLRMNGWSQNCFMIYDPTSESAGVWQRQVLVFPPRSVNKQTTTCEMKYVHWSDLDDDVGKKSNTSSILKFFMVVGTHLCKMATLLCHPRLSRPPNVSRQIGGNHEIPLVFVSSASTSWAEYDCCSSVHSLGIIMFPGNSRVEEELEHNSFAVSKMMTDFDVWVHTQGRGRK